jgi:hypothetical protein
MEDPEASRASSSEGVALVPTRRRRWLRRALAAAVVLGLVCVVVIGPWPADNSSYRGSDFERRTLERLARQVLPGGDGGPLRVGLAETEISPPPGSFLAGFVKQARTPFVKVDTPCFARALTLATDRGATTVLTADLLLINAKLAQEVLDRTALRPEQVYFTASHTHNGPGGWGDHPLEEIVAGRFDPARFRALAEQLADVVARSRRETVPAEVALVTTRPADRQKNRIDPARPTHDQLSALVFRERHAGTSTGGPPIAILAVFGAHGTVFRGDPPRLSSDYAGALAASLKDRTGARLVLFAAGAVGDASPVRPRLRSPSDRSRVLGEQLAGDLMQVLPGATFDARPDVASARLEVELPPLRVPIGATLRFSPLATSWIGGRATHLHVVRIGPAVLVGMPGDYSGHLAETLGQATRRRGLTLVATSFNGDYKGYLVSERVFHGYDCYETRWMNFYGPWAGEYLSDLAGQMIDRIAPSASSSLTAAAGPTRVTHR